MGTTGGGRIPLDSAEEARKAEEKVVAQQATQRRLCFDSRGVTRCVLVECARGMLAKLRG